MDRPADLGGAHPARARRGALGPVAAVSQARMGLGTTRVLDSFRTGPGRGRTRLSPLVPGRALRPMSPDHGAGDDPAVPVDGRALPVLSEPDVRRGRGELA